VIGGIRQGSPAAALGLQPGDVIVSIDRRQVTQPEQAADALKHAATGESDVLLLVNRHGAAEYMALPVTTEPAPG
jgi:serine protease Do